MKIQFIDEIEKTYCSNKELKNIIKSSFLAGRNSNQSEDAEKEFKKFFEMISSNF